MTKVVRKKRELTTWEKAASLLEKLFDKRQYLFSTLTLAISIVLIVSYLTKAKVSSKNDLLNLIGHLHHYSFQERQGRGANYLYYIWLYEYSNAFQIKADFVDYFDRNGFENRMQKGQLVHFTIPKGLTTQLNNSKKKIFIMSINSDHEIFLNKDRTIAFESMNYDLWVAFVSLGFSIIRFCYKSDLVGRLRK